MFPAKSRRAIPLQLRKALLFFPPQKKDKNQIPPIVSFRSFLRLANKPFRNSTHSDNNLSFTRRRLPGIRCAPASDKLSIHILMRNYRISLPLNGRSGDERGLAQALMLQHGGEYQDALLTRSSCCGIDGSSPGGVLHSHTYAHS